MNRYNATDLDGRLTQNEQILYLNNALYDGLVYEMVQGRLDVEYHVVQGKKHGLETEYFPNSAVQSTRYYVDNVLHGELRRYNEHGKLIEQATIYKGVFESAVLYDDNGAIVDEYTIGPNSPEYSWYQSLKRS